MRPLKLAEVTLDSVLNHARSLPGPVLVGIDAAIGVPDHYLEQARLANPAWHNARNFLDWLRGTTQIPHIFDEVNSAQDWRSDRPFIAVGKGKGSLNAFWTKSGGDLKRAVDRSTGAKSPFIVSGIPGTVGSGTRILWEELACRIGKSREFGIWPFEGDLALLSKQKHIVLGEIYPRACYAIALGARLPAGIRLIFKTKLADRERALDELFESSSWIHKARVRISGVERARQSEDDFDAMMSATAMLRCVLDERALERIDASAVEGDILGLGAIDLSLPKIAGAPTQQRVKELIVDSGRIRFSCPIVGCGHVFVGSRGGWDSHIVSLKRHPLWHPAVTDAKRRKGLFKSEFSEWFDRVA